MAFTQATAPGGLRNGEKLSADNALPERHIVIATLRNAAPRLGLSPSVISTLDAMLSCLAPKRNHHTVFASNATLTFRLNGVSDRTVRRHAAVLQEAGLLARHDSPNRKRFTKHSRQDGKALRFGFDLSPLFARLHEIAALAAEILQENEQIDYLRAKIRVAVNAILDDTPDDEMAHNTLRLLRRKLTLDDCQQILTQLAAIPVQAETADEQPHITATNLTANDGQIVRHHHRSNKELIDKESTPITITELLTACPEASKFALHRIETAYDVIAHARTLAPMIGIPNDAYEAAHRRLGPLRAAATVWAILQFHSKIRKVGAYFRAITTGDKSAAFSPEALIRRLANAQLQAV